MLTEFRLCGSDTLFNKQEKLRSIYTFLSKKFKEFLIIYLKLIKLIK